MAWHYPGSITEFLADLIAGRAACPQIIPEGFLIENREQNGFSTEIGRITGQGSGQGGYEASQQGDRVPGATGVVSVGGGGAALGCHGARCVFGSDRGVCLLVGDVAGPRSLFRRASDRGPGTSGSPGRRLRDRRR